MCSGSEFAIDVHLCLLKQERCINPHSIPYSEASEVSLAGFAVRHDLQWDLVLLVLLYIEAVSDLSSP